ncbi:sugar ABC transporter permease [Demequina sp. SYSU T00039]|uniref:Sugar ABC transporter permease n=1 Tax=Demequina lignilytica TaxID=3051663 RepID=A0AAW7M6C5_9MICO|nr:MULTISPECIES: sugar ABC transporter permease [unclassified Demequina]MDN4478835.1 sugar ABC transporter permease [Demequina sp. SYSU T00039-1]MDN4488933.1 sugar ABC transporter permease [Demequina sp. SYSU T00039]
MTETPGRAAAFVDGSHEPSTKAAPARRAQTARKWLEIGVFVAPALLLFIIFVLVPVARAGYYSLYNWNGIEELTKFIGLDNYTRALTDDDFLRALRNNLFFVVGSIAVQLPIALGVALLMNRRMRGRGAFRLLIFVPYVLSEVIAGVMFTLMLQPHGLVDWALSPVYGLLQTLGVDSPRPLWLADTDVVLWTLLLVISWKYIGFAIILFLAGLQGINPELEEAAAIDGASWWQIQRRITIPLLGPTIRIWAFVSVIGSLQLFDMVKVMTNGGPAGSSHTMATYMIQQGFERSQFGYGSAVAVILFAISFVAALVYIRFVLRSDNTSSDDREA